MHDDTYISGRSENNIKCGMHDDLRWKNQTTRYILSRHWLYEWFSQFHRCGTYSVLSQSPSIVRGFYMPNYPALVFYIWHDSLHWLWSYCWETVCQSLTLNFSAHPVGKVCIGSKNDCTFLIVLTSSITVQSFGKITLWMPAVGAKIWCLYVFSVCHTLRLMYFSFEGDILWTGVVSWFMGRFWFCL